MEIHHHPHPDHKKKWKDYLFEFFILFFAVTLSFFAENQRERLAERHKEKEYMISLLEDLKTDTAEIKGTLRFGQYMSLGIDSLTKDLYDVKNLEKNSLSMYRMEYTYLRKIIPQFNDQTITQLRSGNGMSVVKNQKIANEIAHYSTNSKTIESITESTMGKMQSAAEVGYTIFNRKYLLSMRIDTATEFGIVKIDPSACYMTKDTTTFIVFANHLGSVNVSLKTFFPMKMKQQYNLAVQLIADIHKEYDIE